MNRIEDYALIGDTRTAALVGLDGSIDWFCAPRFDSGAMFAALLGTPDNGRWKIAPSERTLRVTRAYRPNSMVLETTFECGSGTVTLVDCMLAESPVPRLIRSLEGRSGRVAMALELITRFDYGSIVPWVRTFEGAHVAVAGPDAFVVRGDVALEGRGLTSIAEFEIGAGERIAFEAVYHPSYEPRPQAIDPAKAIAHTDEYWRAWTKVCRYDGPYREAVTRSLLTLKALTFHPTGAVVAAATTSLPEKLGGVRNWDYRYCWLRDATFVLLALHNGGYDHAAEAWRNWLLRAVAGAPNQLQIMYGLLGERRIPEFEVPWLAGYENSKPVRLGNAAAGQFQLDVYGEVIDALFQGREAGAAIDEDEWTLAKAVIATVEERWSEPDHGLWEIRGKPQHFTHSKVMAWVALDRAVQTIEKLGAEGPLERWRALRDHIHEEICARAYDQKRRTFTQYYGSRELDASTLLLPIVGFLPPDDPRVSTTIEAIEHELLEGGFVRRYTQTKGSSTVDGLPPGEGAFLACSFWLADAYAAVGRWEDAHALFERLLGLRNDVGLLSEEYAPEAQRLVGNYPQAFSHVGLVNTAYNLSQHVGPTKQRSRRESTVPREVQHPPG